MPLPAGGFRQSRVSQLWLLSQCFQAKMVAPNRTRRGSAEIYPPAEPSHFTFCASAFFGSQEITRNRSIAEAVLIEGSNELDSNQMNITDRVLSPDPGPNRRRLRWKRSLAYGWWCGDGKMSDVTSLQRPGTCQKGACRADIQGFDQI
jgi:hypothetical protein